jgi:FKBP-type peptidyl-prolyl cis-trans isomerase FkpA
MRSVFLLLPAVLMAQTPAPTKAPATKAPATKAPATKAAPAVPKAVTAPKAAVGAPAKPLGTARPAAAKAVAPAPVTLTTDEQKTIYAIGLSIYKSLAPFGCSPAELELVKRALSDANANKPAVPLEEWGPKIQGLIATRTKAASEGYLTKAAAEPGATKMESGLIYKDLRAGDGESPKATDTVKVNYRGTLVNGTEFDSSYKRGQPAEFALNGVIPCWTEGVQKMKVGGKAQLVCPSGLAYGDQGNPSIPGGSTLIFEIELLGIGAGK